MRSTLLSLIAVAVTLVATASACAFGCCKYKYYAVPVAPAGGFVGYHTMGAAGSFGYSGLPSYGLPMASYGAYSYPAAAYPSAAYPSYYPPSSAPPSYAPPSAATPHVPITPGGGTGIAGDLSSLLTQTIMQQVLQGFVGQLLRCPPPGGGITGLAPLTEARLSDILDARLRKTEDRFTEILNQLKAIGEKVDKWKPNPSGTDKGKTIFESSGLSASAERHQKSTRQILASVESRHGTATVEHAITARAKPKAAPKASEVRRILAEVQGRPADWTRPVQLSVVSHEK
jgi:hypothetical protein